MKQTQATAWRLNVACEIACTWSATAYAADGASSSKAASATTSAIPFRQEAASSDWSPLRVGVLVILLGLGVAYFYMQRRKNGSMLPGIKKQKHFSIVESQRLGHGTMLHVVEFGGQRHLIAQSAQGVSRIATTDGVASTIDGELH